MSAFHNNMLLGSAKTADLGDPIEQSLRFSGDSVLYRDFSNTNAATSTDTGTFSFWVKRSELSTEQTIVTREGQAWYAAFLGTSDKFAVRGYGAGTWTELPDNQFRDPSAWYHFVVSINSNTVTVYINGTAHTTTLTASDIFSAGTDSIRIGSESTTAASSNLNGYLAEFIFVDGQALTPSSFGKDNEDVVWVPQNYTGSYGNRGFHLTFDSSQDANPLVGIGIDSSGQGNHFTAVDFNTTAISSTNFDNDIDYNDTPTSNYATFNPLSETPTLVVDGANLKIGEGGPAGMPHAPATIGPFTSGKYYMEFEASAANVFGVSNVPLNASIPASSTNNFSWFDDSLGWYPVNGAVYRSSSTYNAFGTPATSGDICAMAVDFDNGTVEYFNSGSSVGVATTTTSALTTGVPYYILHATMGGAPTSTNFGQRPFVYTPPTGYKALQTQNLPEPAIKYGDDHFRAITDTGANILTTAQAAFSTGLWWIKDKVSGNQNQLVDSVRGTGTNTSALALQPSSTTFNTVSVRQAYVPPNGNSVAWCWNYNSSDPEKNGFSITTGTMTGTGTRAINTGLNNPQMIIFYPYAGSLHTISSYRALSNTNFFKQDTSVASAASTVTWTAGSGTVSIDSAFAPAGDYVCYAWSEVPFYSAFGSYVGNNSTDGPFIYTGFKPAFVMTKITDAGDWQIRDNARSPYNPAINTLYPNTFSAEYTGAQADVDLLSNGFKIRNTDINLNTKTYIYAAFAEQPFGGENTPPATAR